MLTVVESRLISLRPRCSDRQEVQQEGESSVGESRAVPTLPQQDVVRSACMRVDR